MIRRNQAFLNRLNILLDMMLVILSYMVASWLWLNVLGGQDTNMAALSWNTVLLSCVYALLLFFLLTAFGFYNTTRSRRIVWKVRILFVATTLAVLLASTLLYLFRLMDFSRGVLGLFYGFTLASLIGKYAFMRLLFRSLRARGYNIKHVVVVGTGPLARQYAEDIRLEPGLGVQIRGFVGGQASPAPDFLGTFDQLESLLMDPGIDETVIALEPSEYPHIQRLIAACEKNGVKYFVIPFYNDMIPAHPIIETIGRSKLIDMRANRLDNLMWALLKRGFDLVCSLLGLILLSPLMAAIAIGVKCSSPGPVLFKQVRVGYRRREFRMLKFRSMRQNDLENTAWSSAEDDRRTPFGSLIRKTSLDELPQLWNILRGDMSLVGPRPELPYFVDQFRETIPFYMVKHQVKPGVTGWAQVNGWRGDTDLTERIRYDIWYIDHWSVWLDLKILFMTAFGKMLNGEKLARRSPAAEKGGGDG